ncbi:MAG: ATP-binding cassette domain-containing protein [Crocinitomicaceae bacterium]
MLKVENLTVAYDKKQAVKNCSFQMNEGEILVVLAASGEGKTTLLKAIAGLLPHLRGNVYFRNEKVSDAAEQLLPGHELIRLVNQDFELDAFHTVEENIRLKLLRFNKAYQDQRIISLLRLGRLTPLRNKKASELSGGQQQRLAIARALADEPELLLLDEPFNQLDFQTKTKIADHIKRYLKKNNIAAIMVTHNGVEAMEWADKIIFMEKGRIKRMDTPEFFFNHPDNIKEASFFGQINRLKIKGKVCYFRPGFFSAEKTAAFKRKLEVTFLEKKNLGWYAAFTFSFDGQPFQLFSTEDISNLKQVYIRFFEFND